MSSRVLTGLGSRRQQGRITFAALGENLFLAFSNFLKPPTFLPSTAPFIHYQTSNAAGLQPLSRVTSLFLAGAKKNIPRLRIVGLRMCLDWAHIVNTSSHHPEVLTLITSVNPSCQIQYHIHRLQRLGCEHFWINYYPYLPNIHITSL